MIKEKNIQNLLSQVNTISKSYEKVAQATGENFNIFSVLGIEHYEEGTHSRFIAHLLNPKGQHGFGNKFFKLFLEMMCDKSEDFDKENFDEDNYLIKTELVIGPINKDYTKGGRIDILLFDKNENAIMIENKIYAEEQRNQLLRYRNAYPKGLLLFLTLQGDDSISKSSKNINYLRVSYCNDIIMWLEACQRIAIDNPVVRETIKQYKNLINKLTNQNINSQMKEEIFKLILDSEENFTSLIELKQLNMRNVIIEETIKPIISEIANSYNLETTFYLSDWPNFRFENKALKDKNIGSLCFSSSSVNGFTNMVYGIVPMKERDLEKELIIKKLFSEYFDAYSGSGYKNWIALSYFNPYRSLEDYNILKDIQFNKSDFKNSVEEKVKIMIKIIDEI
jgi:hypothetical protein